MLPQLMKPTGLSSVWCQGTCGTSKKACVSGGVNYPLKPVTPGYQDAALTEVKRAQSPQSIIVYTQAHGDGLCTLLGLLADH